MILSWLSVSKATMKRSSPSVLKTMMKIFLAMCLRTDNETILTISLKIDIGIILVLCLGSDKYNKPAIGTGSSFRISFKIVHENILWKIEQTLFLINPTVKKTSSYFVFGIKIRMQLEIEVFLLEPCQKNEKLSIQRD